MAVTRVRKQSHQAHFSGENDLKLGKSGQKKIGTKIIGPKSAENHCRLCRKLQKRNEIATGKANAAADADSEIEDRPRARPERARRVLEYSMKPALLFVQQFGFRFVYEQRQQCVTCPTSSRLCWRLVNRPTDLHQTLAGPARQVMVVCMLQ